jgi:hypothetical protein
LHLRITANRPKRENYISFSQVGSRGLPEEGYRLVIGAKTIRVIGQPARLFYGMQTLTQLRADAFVEVVDATPADSQLLGVITGRGLLCMNCITTRADGLAFSLETTKYHPDRYRFRAILERRAGT